ncbi:MAG TPA: hypothetical protein VFT89_07510 [Rhizobiaceae bacterium]|nr:hypothetical protein [Rhizobiaceae bacterium]
MNGALQLTGLDLSASLAKFTKEPLLGDLIEFDPSVADKLDAIWLHHAPRPKTTIADLKLGLDRMDRRQAIFRRHRPWQADMGLAILIREVQAIIAKFEGRV